MSYCRFAVKDNEWGLPASDLYVFLDSGGFLYCCGCRLAEHGFMAFRTKDMLAHIEEHRRAGHTVEDELVPRLQEDAAENDRWIKRRMRQMSGVRLAAAREGKP